jgi:hypothetical protein
LVDFKDIYTKIFRAIRDDDQLVSLLEIDKGSLSQNDFIKKLRKQVMDTSNPGDMLNDYSTKICIHEAEGSHRFEVEDYGYVALDIHTTQDKDAIDRRHLKVLKRLIEVLDSKERKKEGKEPLDIGLQGLVYTRRPSTMYVSTGWEKHTVLFEYKFLTTL